MCKIFAFLVVLVAVMQAKAQPASTSANQFGGSAVGVASQYDKRSSSETSPASRFLAPPLPEVGEQLFGAHIQRSMTLLESSSRELRRPVRILIYGQSITGNELFTRHIGAYLAQQFPFADVQLENRSIGGFEAPWLVRTAVHDLYPYYPDLVIFHVYGGQRSGEAEEIISNIRRYTTSDILLINDHRLSKEDIDETSVAFWKRIAQEYNCELVDVSTEWNRYLHEHALNPDRLLSDGVHPNEDGYVLLTDLVARHLRFNSIIPNDWESMVRTYDARRPLDEGKFDEIRFSGVVWSLIDDGIMGSSPRSGLHMEFDGNRVVLIAAQSATEQKLGTARILLDGKPPSQNPDVFAITRPSAGPNTWFPAVMRVSHTKPLIVEDWTLRITHINRDAMDFGFEVIGSKTGPDGSGNSKEVFISNSGRVKIEPRDWMFATIMSVFKQKDPPPVGYEVHWSVAPMFVDVYSATATPDATRVYQSTLFQLISNEHHTLDIVPTGDGSIPIKALEVYRPALR